MTLKPLHLVADVKKRCEYRPSVSTIVLFGLEVKGEQIPPVYMEIRFVDYESQKIEGDHVMLSLEEALEFAEKDYGILKDEWREMSEVEIARITWSTGFDE